MIPYSRQHIVEEDIEAVVSVLKSDFLTQGPVVPAFEKSLSEYCEAKYAVAVSSATAALHLACLALELKAGDYLWTSAISFVASANCGLYCGAQVDFIDVDVNTGLMSIDQLEEKLNKAAIEGRIPKVLVVVQLAGQCCDMKRVASVCHPYGVKIIEDASHALGGSVDGAKVGACHYSDCTVFSFHPVKPITCGEGGALLTNNQALAQRVRLLASHGITRDIEKLKKTSVGPWHYEQQALGFNYRLSDIHAALGLSQMQRIDQIVADKNIQADRYDQIFSEVEFVTPLSRQSNQMHAWHLYVLIFQNSELRDSAYRRLRGADFAVNVHYEPIPDQPYYQDMMAEPITCLEARDYSRRALSIPLFYGCSEVVQDSVFSLCLGDENVA